MHPGSSKPSEQEPEIYSSLLVTSREWAGRVVEAALRLEELTWDGDNRDAVIGHHSGGAAVLHIEVGRLEAASAEPHRERGVRA